MTKDPILSVQILLLIHEPLKFHEITMVSYIETESHSWVYLCVMDFLSITFVEGSMVFLNRVQVVVDGLFGVVRVQKDKVIFLHAY